MSSIVDAVSGSELDNHLQAISRVVRLSGTLEEAEAFDYIESTMRRFGYQVNRYESDALIGYPQSAELHVLSPSPINIGTNGYSLSPNSGPEGVTGELAYVGAGSAADYEGRDVEGKVALSDGLAMPAKTLAASHAGAIAQIHINDEHIHEMCISPIWGTPIPETAHLLPSVPSVAVTRDDGERLREMLQQGPVTVRVMTAPFREWVKIPTLTAELPGARDDTYVLFSGHVDSWHYGAMDNGTANATQLEVARILATRRDSLRRGVRFAFWSGHSHGRYASSTWYADTFWRDIHDRCACHVNVDSVGGIGATVLEEAPTMAETYRFGQKILRNTVGVELDYRRISRSSDQSFWGHGVPTLFASLSEQPRGESATGSALSQLLGGGGKAGGLGWWWHTTEDTLDKIDPAFLVRDARVYAETLWQLCTMERLDFDPAAGATEMVAALTLYGTQAGGTIDLAGTEAIARETAAAIRRIDLDRLDDASADDLTLQLCKTLIPVNYTAAGPFGHDLALRSLPIPGLSDAALLALLDRHEDQYHFLRTRLVRERNRVEHALITALRIAESAS
jgi:hypothetical protein